MSPSPFFRSLQVKTVRKGQPMVARADLDGTAQRSTSHWDVPRSPRYIGARVPITLTSPIAPRPRMISPVRAPTEQAQGIWHALKARHEYISINEGPTEHDRDQAGLRKEHRLV